jgi:hypothetical protein
MEKRTVLTLYVIILIAAAGQSMAQQWRQSDFIIGSWHDPCIHQPDDMLNFQVCKNAYFNLLSGGNGMTWRYQYGQSEIDYALSLASGVGLKSLVPHEPGNCNNRMTFETFQRNSNTDNYAFSIVQHYQSRGVALCAALQGYWVGHEPPPSPDSFSCGSGDGFTHVIDTIKMWTKAFRTLDPAKLSFVLIRPFQNSGDYFTPPLPDGLKDTALYKVYIDKAFNGADVDSQPQVVGNNIYPLWCHSFDFRQYPADSVEKNFFWCLTACHAKAGNRPFWNAVHCIDDSGSLAQPDENNLRWYAFTNVAHGVKGILWFTYWSINRNAGPYGHFGNAIVDCDNVSLKIDPAQRTEYTVIREINRYLACIVGPMVMTSDFVNAYHKAVSGPDAGGNYTVVPGQVYIPGRQILAVTGGADDSVLYDLGDSAVMAGVFRDGVDPAIGYILVVNKHWERNAAALINCTVTLKGDRRNSVFLAPRCYGYNGSTVFSRAALDYSAGYSTVTIPELKGGEGRLIKVTNAGRGRIKAGFRPQGEIAVARNDRDNRLICFARGTDNRIYARIQDTANVDFWGTQWVAVGGLTGITVNMAATNFGADSRIWIFSTDGKGSLRYTFQQFPADKAKPLSFGPWHAIVSGKAVCGPLSLSFRGASKRHLVIFFKGGNNCYYAYDSAGAGFAQRRVTARGIPFAVGAAIATGYNPGDGSVDIFVTDGGTHELYRARMSAARSWSSFTRCGIASDNEIAVGTNADNRLEVFVSSGGYVYHSLQNVTGSSSWSPFCRLDPAARIPEVPDDGTGRLSVACNSDGRLEIFAKGSDGLLKHVWQTNANSNWFSGGLLPVGGGPVTIGTGPVCTAGNGDKRISLFSASAGATGIFFTSQCRPGSGTDWQNFLPFTNISDSDQ